MIHYYQLIFIPILLVAFFDPQNGLGLRQPLIYLLIPLWIYGIKSVLTNIRGNVLTLTLGYIAPLWGMVIYSFRGGGSLELSDTSYISFAIVYSFIHLLGNEKSQGEFKKASIACGLLFSSALIYSAMELLLLNKSDSIDFAIDRNIARISFREYGGINIPYVYYYASALLILPLAILLHSVKNNEGKLGNHLCFIVLLTALFLSGTRSHITISMAFALIYAYVLGGALRLFAIAALSAAAIYYIGDIANVLGDMFSSAEPTSAQKISMLGLYASIFNDPITLLVGQGFQAVDWSQELRQMVYIEEGATKTELTYIELFRVFGVPLSCAMLSALAVKIFKRSRDGDGYKKIVLVALLFNSTLNPHLISTYGAIMLAISMSPFLVPKKNISKTIPKGASVNNIYKYYGARV